ncbi:helix-turn-helix domain-containing protein [Dyadobacter tibetensis]|uniref:helix-turn-helix domain-containing protein n=1 Tax=Dyadobacter tibetensis TaxID=1211851 RepID=UPI000471843E|nr:AraC family transcriptional regulator [Dyadobacter tibetensis]
MEIKYYPVLSEKSNYHYCSTTEHKGRENTDKIELTRSWKTDEFSISRNELITDNLTLTTTNIQSKTPILIHRNALPLNDLYIIDLISCRQDCYQIYSRENFICCKENQYWGLSTGTVQSIFGCQSEMSGTRIEIKVGRYYLLEMISKMGLGCPSKGYEDILQNADFYSLKPMGSHILYLFQKLLKIQRTDQHKEFSQQQISTHLVLELIEEVLQAFFSASAPAFGLRSEDQLKIREICELIKNRLDQKFTIMEASSHCNMSTTKFKNIFKSVTGHSFTDYYTKIRMEEALSALNHQRPHNLTQLSLQLGYKNLSQFTRAFKEYYHKSPSAILKDRTTN